MIRKIDGNKLRSFVEHIQTQLKHCPFCGSHAQIENNVGSWDCNSEFEIHCSNDNCFLHDNGITVYDAEDWQDNYADSLTGLKKMLGRMKAIWNRRPKPEDAQ